MRRAEIVAAARRWIGTPYQHQASLPGIGCDCLGLLRGVWREVAGPEPEHVPPYTRDWARADGTETLLAAAARHFVAAEGQAFMPGDVLVFRWREKLPATHLAIAATASTMVHAHEGAAVAEVAVAPWWHRHLVAIFSFPGVRV